MDLDLGAWPQALMRSSK
ncbi:hypothetical protein KL938_004967, partial [Ogataea parapolymorpha]